ncbi:MAG: hypothetical protein ACXWPS_09025, partial [Ktedonobacteraceae bacterium]
GTSDIVVKLLLPSSTSKRFSSSLQNSSYGSIPGWTHEIITVGLLSVTEISHLFIHYNCTCLKK